MTTDTSIPISGYSNEDIIRQYQIKSGTAASSTPYDLTGVTLEADIRDAKDLLVIRLTSASDDGGITITDAANGQFQIKIAQGSIAYQPNRSMRYDLLMVVGGSPRRLWGGGVTIQKGTTTP